MRSGTESTVDTNATNAPIHCFGLSTNAIGVSSESATGAGITGFDDAGDTDQLMDLS